jgi:4-amino-4-deoxy-L-arabinose transferase-like glycosyltransferase
MKKKNQLVFLYFIILVGFFVRIVGINSNPQSLNWDEVSHGYNAYSILKTGKDEWDVAFPAIFRAYGDYKLPVYIYTTVVSIFLFGVNAIAVRLPSILAGILAIYFTYALAEELFSEKKYRFIPLASAFLVAIEPWSLFLSRGAYEANFSFMLIVSGVYFFIKGVKKPLNLIFASLLLGLSVWTYNSARVFVPLFLLYHIYLYRTDLYKKYYNNKKYFHVSLIILILFIRPMVAQLSSPEGMARYSKVAILNSGAVDEINIARNASSLNPTVTRIVYNKATKFASEFVKNWISHYSGNYLFFEGGSHYQFSLPGYGLIYLVNAPLLLIGVFLLLKEKSRRGLVILGWFFFGSVPSAITSEAPHVLRSITMLPSPMIITSYGIVKSFYYLKKRFGSKMSVTTIIYSVVLVVLLSGYLRKYFTYYKKDYSWSWQYGYQQIVNYAKDNYSEFDKIVVTKKYGEPHEFFLFFWPWDPASYKNDPNLNRFYQSNWYWVDGFDKFYFVNDWQIVDTDLGNYTFKQESGGLVYCTPKMFDCLLITSPGNVPDGWNKLETFSFLNGEIAFEIYEN